MNRIFLTSDLHIGHDNILKFEHAHRPFQTIEEHDHQLVDNYNNVVGKNDICWFLGDICWKREKLHLFGRLNGTRHLILGNHDTFKMSDYAQYFQKIRALHVIKGCILSHIPVHTDQVGPGKRFKLNIHGHLHSRNVMEHIPGLGLQDDTRYRNVSVEQTGLKPILLDEVING